MPLTLPHTRAAAVLAALAASPALAADCPVGADMDEGVRFSEATGNVEVIKRGEAPGEVVSTYGSDGYLNVVRLAHGVYVTEITNLVNGVPEGAPDRYSYDISPLPAPAPGLEVAAQVTVTGAATKEQTWTYSFGEPVTWTYGSCAYEVIPITTRQLAEGEEVSREVLHYLPEFGHSYLSVYADGEIEEVYTYVSVEAVR